MNANSTVRKTRGSPNRLCANNAHDFAESTSPNAVVRRVVHVKCLRSELVPGSLKRVGLLALMRSRETYADGSTRERR